MAQQGTYVCSLDEDSLQKAMTELNENPDERASQIEALRQWVESQPHLKSRTDDMFLLMFLRRAKFSQLKARELIDNFWTVRSSPTQGVPDWFDRMDPADPRLTELMDLPTALPLPGRDSQNRKVVLVKTGAWDPKVHDFGDVMRLGFMSTDVLLQDELNQVHGFVILLDFTEFGASHVLYWSRDTISKAMKCWQDVYPTRNKAINYYNTPTLFNALFEIFKYFMKEKTRQRVKLHWSSLESLYKEIPKSMLPEEYGGDAGPIKNIIADWKKLLLKHKEQFEEDAKCSVDEDKRPKTEVPQAGGWGITGSFRKLQVD